jgi:YHS domain-containing protein
MNFSPARALRHVALLVVSTTVLWLAGCGAMTAQNPPGGLRPVNAVSEGPDERLILKGADVVSYFVDGRYAQGKPELKSTYEGVTFRFSKPEHKARFDREPAKYMPQFGGYCANGIVYGIPWGGDADTWRMIDGKLYIFGGKASQDAFELDMPGNMKLANKYWAEEVAGSNSFWQRSKRLVFRVPHYKTGEELDRMVAQAKAPKP